MTIINAVTANLKLKIFALFLAVVVWLFVTLNGPGKLEMLLQITTFNLPRGIRVEEIVPSAVTVRLAGPRILLIRQQLTGTRVNLDLTGASSGATMYKSLERYVSLVPGVRTLGIAPETVAVVTSMYDRPDVIDKNRSDSRKEKQ